MKSNFFQRLWLKTSEWRNYCLFRAFIFVQPLYRFLFQSDIAYLYTDHPVITPFIIRLKTKMGINVHALTSEEDFSPYRKVIVPNGMWDSVRSATEKIPHSKRVYCEVGFFPQNHNIYLDDQGVHGHSSIRDVVLEPLTETQKAELEQFRNYYIERNFVKHRWATIDDRSVSADRVQSGFEKPFIFVPLQLESDTAFQLCPFETNQEMISSIEEQLPGQFIVFKVHPWDTQSEYRVRSSNLLLPYANRDLKILIQSCEAVVNCNSTVMLEAMLYGKKCASLGTGFVTNHNVALECHQDVSLLSQVMSWEPDSSRVDSFLHYLVRKQISVNFPRSHAEKERLMYWLRRYELV